MTMLGIALIAIVAAALSTVVVAGSPMSILSKDDDHIDELEVPLQDVFLEFNHDSTKSWLKWIDGQDESKKQFAYEKLVNYLERPPKKLGAITKDVVKAIVVFKRKTDAFDILVKLLKKTRNHFSQFKSIDIFYEAAAIGLTKIDYSKAEGFLINELEEIKYRQDLIPIQIYLIRALSKLDFTPDVEKCWVRILSSHEYPDSTKKELIDQLEEKGDSIKSRVFLKIINNQIDCTTSKLNEIDAFILEEIFYKLKKLITQEDYDSDIWNTLSRACDSPKLSELFIKLFGQLIEFEGDSLSQNQLLELINKKEPARSTFIRACSIRHRLTNDEIFLLKIPFKEEDLEFEKTKLNIEKSKKTKAVSNELAADYRYLEKSLLAYESGKTDKASSSAIAILSGTGEKEKFYLSRCFAANYNKSFIYVDFQQILGADGMVKEFKNHVANAKPCLVYIDNMEKVLNVSLEKRLANNLKTLNKSIKDLSILPSITFVANIPYNRDVLKDQKSDLHSKFLHSASNMYSMTMNKDKPSEKDRNKIFSSILEKISIQRLEDSINFDLEELIEFSKDMDLIDLVKFIHKYLEISLIANGRLISLEEFKNRWTESEENLIRATTAREIEAEESDESESEEVSSGEIVPQESPV